MRILIIMTPSIQGLRFVYTFLLFPTIQVFCANTLEMKELMRTLKKTFGYNFKNAPVIGDVFIWKISNNHEPSFTSLQYNRKDIQFGSNETFIIFTPKFTTLYIVYYWLGRNTLLVDKQAAAKYAILLFHNVQNAELKNPFRQMNIARETEDMESDSFYRTMKKFNRHSEPDADPNMFEKYLDFHFPSPRPNLYVVWGIEHSRMKKIPFSLGLRWLVQKDICMIPEFEYEVMENVVVNFFCNTEASEKQIERSREFASWLFYYHNSSLKRLTHRIEIYKNLNEFKEFLQTLEDIIFYNPDEIDNSNDHMKNAAEFIGYRDEEILLYDVTYDGLKLNSRRPIRSSMFQNQSMGYLLDTKSVAGVFLVLSYLEHNNTSVKAIQLAEEYLDETYVSSPGRIIKMRITETALFRHIVDFEINLSDHPPIERNLPDEELW